MSKKLDLYPKLNQGWKTVDRELIPRDDGTVLERVERVRTYGVIKKAFFNGFLDEVEKIARRKKKKKKRDMPPFTKQNRPAKVKEIYNALKRDHPGMPAEKKARIAARQGKPGKQKQGPPYSGPLTKAAKERQGSGEDPAGALGAVLKVLRRLGRGADPHLMRKLKFIASENYPHS